ncbi:MAG: MOSC domain-containing protein [Candidatus Binatia bacterium]
MQVAKVVQINVSGGGVPKRPTNEAKIGFLGIEGDAHNDKKYHGGPQRALCLFSLEVIEKLRGEGHPIAPGTAGENLTISGLDWASVKPGKRYRLGPVEIEITSFTSPCRNIIDSFKDGDFIRISNRLYEDESRVYAKVLKPGMIAVGVTVKELMDD